jgi:hypothetical protein
VRDARHAAATVPRMMPRRFNANVTARANSLGMRSVRYPCRCSGSIHQGSAKVDRPDRALFARLETWHAAVLRVGVVAFSHSTHRLSLFGLGLGRGGDDRGLRSNRVAPTSMKGDPVMGDLILGSAPEQPNNRTPL